MRLPCQPINNLTSGYSVVIERLVIRRAWAMCTLHSSPEQFYPLTALASMSTKAVTFGGLKRAAG
jgi:hypothetical protein